ncbi:hypothetical protein C8J56DRAFT_1055418 [Mycena floridula]|nr:hypothetical protein C8J56DRAFT_1055418 [Mycena floridula]
MYSMRFILFTILAWALTLTGTLGQGQGPVGQPGETPSGSGPTPYTYTTVVDGQLTAVVDVFTPTSPPTVGVTPVSSGTILDYSSWLAIYGSTAAPSNAKSSFSLHRAWLFSGLLSLLAGVWIIWL